MPIERKDLAELKHDLAELLEAHLNGVKTELIGVNRRLDIVNGRLNAQGDQIIEHVEDIAKLKQQATNLDREVFGRRRDDPTPEENEDLTIALRLPSSPSARRLLTKKTLGWFVAAAVTGFELFRHVKAAVIAAMTNK
jgi:hypothetical protein